MKEKKTIFDKKKLIFLLIPLFEPTIFVKINAINYFYSFYLVVVLTYLLITYLKNRVGVPNLLLLVILYRALLFIPTFENDGDLLKWGYLSIVITNLILVLNIGLKKNTKNLFDCILILFSVLLVINLLLYFRYPKGLLNYNGLHFLGIRTRFTDYAFPTITISFYSFLMTKNKKYIIPILISFANMTAGEISTAYVGIAIFLVLYCIHKNKKDLKKSCGTRLFVYALLISFLVVNFRILDYFNPAFEFLFGKTSSLSGRTEIWDSAIPVIKKNILFGNGIINDGSFVPMETWKGIVLRQSHNQTLQLLYDGGVFSTIIFYIIMFLSFKRTNNTFFDKSKIVFPISLFAMTIMMITEIYSYYPAPYLLIFLCYFINAIDYKSKEDTND